MLSSVPLPGQGQPDPNITSSFACWLELEGALTCLFRAETGQGRLGFAFLMLLHTAARVGVLQAVTTGGWEGLISSGQKAREEEMCLHTD